jgi:Na+/melibiose symporter-like transporter
MSQTTAAAPAAPVVDLPTKVKIAYYIYPFLNAVSTVMSLQYLTFFVTEWTGVSPTLMATVYTIARFGDLGVQAISGAIMQNVKRMRPILIIIPLVSQTGTIISFLNPNINLTAKLVLLIVGYCCIHFPMNFSTVTVNTLMMKVTRGNPSNRLFITGAAIRGGAAMRIIISAVTMPSILFLLGKGLPGYLIMSLIYGTMAMAANLVLFFATKDFEPKDAVVTAAAAPKPPSIFKMYALASKNLPVMILLMAAIVTGIGGQVYSTGLQYYWRYSIGDQSFQATQGVIAGFVALGTSLIGPVIAKRIGKKRSMMFNYLWTLVMYIGLILFADGQRWVFVAISSLMSVSTNVSMSWGIILWLDAAEIQLYETGVDIRSFIMSLNNYPIKLGFIISGPFVAFMLNNSGYYVAEGGQGVMADTSRFMFIWMIIPIIGLCIAALSVGFGYRVNSAYAEEAATANAKAAAERMAAAGQGN